MNQKVFWIDSVQDDMEARGILPGHIFESNIQIPGYDSGVVVATYRTKPEGLPPRNYHEVREIFARKNKVVVAVERRDLKQYFSLLKNKFF